MWRWRTTSREFTRRGSVPLRSGEDTVDTALRRETDPLLSTKKRGSQTTLPLIWLLCVPDEIVADRRLKGVASNQVVKQGGIPQEGIPALVRMWLQDTLRGHAPGERLGELTFFDDEEASVTQGERLWYCPGCRSRLGLLSLRPWGYDLLTQS